MALSLESIYEPVNNFFVNKFKTGPESRVFFRFDKFGSVISEEHFIDPEMPDNTARAQEAFSDLTNRIPVEDSDGINAYFGGDLIDARYKTILDAAIPFARESDPNKEEIVNAFMKIRSNAMREWENLSTARASGVLDPYRPSFATPSNWYDKKNAGIWTKHSFEITESVTPRPRAKPATQLWKLKLDDKQLAKILPSLGAGAQIEPIRVVADVAVMKPSHIVRTLNFPTVRDHRTSSSLALSEHPVKPPAALRRPGGGGTLIANTQTPRPPLVNAGSVLALPANFKFVQQNLKASLRSLDLTNRLAVLHYIRENAPTQASSASKLKINFEYCVVNIRRPWLIESFIRNKSWFIPGTPKGGETAPGPDMNLTALPIGFIAIRNLSIEANWSKVDIDASKNATDFGPFEVSTEIVNNKLSHEGIQILAHQLQRMIDLPPNDPPQ